MENIFKKLKDILNSPNDKFQIEGLIVYLITGQDVPYKLYKLNMSTNTDMYAIVHKRIGNASNSALSELSKLYLS